MRQRRQVLRGDPHAASDEKGRRQQQLAVLTARLKANAKAKLEAPIAATVEEPHAFFDPCEIPFIRTGSLQKANLSDGVAGAVNAFRMAVRDRRSSVILNWPRGLPGVSALHGIAFLCELAEGPNMFRGLTTLFFPASARTGANQQALLVDRDWLLEMNKPWLNAYHAGLQENSASTARTQARFHNMIARARDLCDETLSNFRRAQAVVDRSKERGHPNLFELVPRRMVESSGAITMPEETFLDRSRKLSELLTRQKGAADYQRIEAVDPDTTPWLISAIHGVSPTSSWISCTAPSRRKPDVVLIDLQYRARARIGENWRRELMNAVSCLRHGNYNLPIVAVTDDPFVAAYARLELAPKQKGRQQRRPLSVLFIRQNDPALLSQRGRPEGATEAATGDFTLDVQIFASDMARFVAEAMRVRQLTAKLADGAIARSIGICLSRLRAIANSPLSQSRVSDALTDPEEPHASNRMLETFNLGAPLADLTANAAQAGNSEADVVALIADAKRLAASLSSSADSTIKRELRSRLEALPRRGKRTLVVASGVAAAQLLERWIEDDPELHFVANRLGQKFDVVAARDAIAEIEIAAASTKPFGHLLLLSPPPRDVLALLCSPACPKKAELLVDASSAKFIADYADALLKFSPETESGRARICNALQVLRSSLKGEVADLPDFDLGDPVGGGYQVVDLTNQSREAGTPIIEITTLGGEVIHAYPQSIFVSRKSADLERFEYLAGADLVPGREILVPSAQFLEALRESSEFRAAAAPLLSEYHNAVRERTAQIPGESINVKAQRILMDLSNDVDAPPTLASVSRWLDVARQDNVPIDLRVPQAPRRLRHFQTFCNALGVDNTLSDIYWAYAITPTRGGRIRSGLQLRKLYASALIDPDAVVRANSAARALTEVIRDLSTEHVSEVVRIERIG